MESIRYPTKRVELLMRVRSSSLSIPQSLHESFAISVVAAAASSFLSMITCQRSWQTSQIVKNAIAKSGTRGVRGV